MQAPNRIRHALRKDLTKGVSTYASRCKGGACPADGNQSGAAIAGPERLWAARPLRRPRRGSLAEGDCFPGLPGQERARPITSRSRQISEGP